MQFARLSDESCQNGSGVATYDTPYLHIGIYFNRGGRGVPRIPYRVDIFYIYI